jgi:hypothetical protein
MNQILMYIYSTSCFKREKRVERKGKENENF